MAWSEPPQRWSKPKGLWRAGLMLLALAALASLCLEYGFEAPFLPVEWLVGVQLAAVVGYLSSIGARMVRAGSVRSAFRAVRFELGFLVLAALLLAGEAEFSRVGVLRLGAAYVGTMQVLFVLRFSVGAARWNLEMSHERLHPSRLLVTGFLVVIVVGGLLLSLPKAVTPEVRAAEAGQPATRMLKSFFTATSATCVTGLVVYDTGRDFTRFGQIVILLLIQLGGLGIMISSTLFGLLAGRQLSLHQSLVLQDELSGQTVGRMGSAIRFIVVVTLVCELVGALLCYPMFAARLPAWQDRVFHSVFHAVSAFCNAGFALQADSLISYRSSWGVYVSIMPLIVLGGLGFPVLRDLWGLLRSRFAAPVVAPVAREFIIQARTRVRPPYRLKLHTKLVLVTTLILIIAPALLFFTFESVNPATEASAPAPADAMTQMTVGQRAGAALFQSVTARTAGFNTAALDTKSMAPESHFLLMIIMFIGGSPASTAGGVKTVAIALLTLGVIDTLRRRSRVEAFGRTIPEETVRRAAVVVMVMFGVVSTVAILLCVTESAPFIEILFESVSACGTVGLSTGLTGHLTAAGQLIIMAGMFAGRLGPLTVMIALAGGKATARYAYPTERVSIG